MKPKTKKKWVPKIGEKYWSIAGDITPIQITFDCLLFDSARIDAGNCFKNKTQAQKMAAKFKKLLKEGV